MNHNWSKNIVHWVEGDTAFISVVFTWQLPEAFSMAVWYKQQGYHVRAGGVAVKLLPDYLAPVAEIGGEIDALPRHNPNATFTSRGCIRNCQFCAVPKIEGGLRELTDWKPKPIICDNNLLATSQKHFDTVVDRLKPIRNIDFNQGLDARLLNSHHLERLKELDIEVLRFAWDNVNNQSLIMAAINRALDSGFPKSKIRVYVLFNFRDTPEDALYRCNTLKKLGILVNVQRYQPLYTLKKNSYIAPGWNQKLLGDFATYWSRQRYLSPIPFKEFRRHKAVKIPARAMSAFELSQGEM